MAITGAMLVGGAAFAVAAIATASAVARKCVFIIKDAFIFQPLLFPEFQRLWSHAAFFNASYVQRMRLRSPHACGPSATNAAASSHLGMYSVASAVWL